MPLHQIRLFRRMHADRHIGLPHREIEVPVIEDQRHRDLGILLEEELRPGGEPG